MSTKSKSSGRSCPGNPVEEARLYEQWVSRLGRALLKLNRVLTSEEDDDMKITEIKVLACNETRVEPMVVVKALVGGERFVGFSSGPTAAEALAGAIERIDNASLKFRPERPYVAASSEELPRAEG